MAEAVTFPDVEYALEQHLTSLVGVPVVARIPSPRPAQFVQVTRVGGPLRNVVTDAPMVTVECWAPTDVEARELARVARAYVHAMAGEATTAGVWVRSVGEVGGPQSYPDPVSGSPRVQFTVQLTVRGAPLGG